MKRIYNTSDRIAFILLGGKMDGTRRNAEEEARSLLENMSDVNEADCEGRTVLLHCCGYGYTDLAKYAIEKGADVNQQDHDGWTPLHIAVKFRNAELVKCLLAKGASPNLLNKFGNNASWDAYRNWDTIKLLLDHGCDIRHKNKAGVSTYDTMVMLIPELAEKYRSWEAQSKDCKKASPEDPGTLGQASQSDR